MPAFSAASLSRLWLALLAPLYVLSPLALLGLTRLRALPRTARWVLLAYALSQQVPALFAPAPAEASVLALARTLLMGGLIGLGTAWRRSERLMPLGAGLVVVIVTAVVMTVLSGAPLLSGRLSHPYMTPITLGLAGAVSVWLALFGSGHRGWRVALGAVGVAALMLSASRGPLLAAAVGIAAGLLVRTDRRVALGVGGAGLLAAALATFSFRGGHDLLTRLVQADTNGRDLVWAHTLSAIQSAPWSGVGSYLLGGRLQPPSAACELWIGPGGTPTCPAWLQALGSPWLIAHNGPLQQLAETGPLGLVGLFVLLGTVVLTAWRTKDALGSAVLTGLLVATATDNTLLVPSPFFGEVFWIVAGMQLARLNEFRVGHGVTGAVTLAALAFPVWVSASASRPDPALTAGALRFLRAPERVSRPEDYDTYSSWRLPPGQYRLVLSSCDRSCALITVAQLDLREQKEASLHLRGTLRNVPTQTLRFQVYPAASGASALPLLTHTWTVRVGP